MADSKITALTALTSADPANDMIPIVDVSDTPPASGNTKRISINNILACSPSATLASATITGDLTVRTNKLAVTSTGVGFGNTSPTEAVDVTGNAFVRGDVNIFSSTGGAVVSKSLIFGSAANTSAASIYSQTNSATAGQLFLATETGGVMTDRLQISDTGVFSFLNVGGVAGTGLTLNATSNLVLRGGTAAANGVGLTFPATQVASSDANCLDDYVESTFSPTIVGSTTAGTATYSLQTGRATKVGRLVTFSLRVIYTVGLGTGNLRIGGLPFTAGVSSNFSIVAENIALTAGNYPVAAISSGNTYIGIDQLPTGGGAASAVPYDVAGDIQISGSYIV